MPTYRAQVVVKYFTNIPQDVWTNTFHFLDLGIGTMEAAADLITPKLQSFYQGIYTVGTPMANYCNTTLADVKWYDLADPEPRVPYLKQISPASANGVSVVPTEAAAVLSFQGLRVSGTPQARRRGRVYLGGLSSACMVSSSAAQFPNLSGSFVANIASMADTNLLNMGIPNLSWAVWSPTTGLTTVVNDGWVDNSPDTQRRRSVAPTTRTVWS